MMFLIIKMAVYLIIAGLIGVVAGWLLRNLQGQRHEESAARVASDAKSKLPQMESLLRGRDDLVTKLYAQLADAQAELNQTRRSLRKAKEFDAREVENKVLAQEQTSVQANEQEIAAQQKLAEQKQLAEQLTQQLEEAQSALRHEQETVRDLETERTLQTSSMRALNHQLELARRNEGLNTSAQTVASR